VFTNHAEYLSVVPFKPALHRLTIYYVQPSQNQ